jgi:diguanylate cyclase (GGDEF)-like protein
MTYSQQSIRQQLIRYGLYLTALTLTIFMLCTLAFETYSKHQTLINIVHTSADIIGRNSVAAILFSNEQDAHELLTSLEAVPEILQAAILLPDGSILAKYRANGPIDCQPINNAPELILANKLQFNWCSVLLYHPITLHDQQIGSVVLEHSTKSLGHEILINLLFSLIAIAITLAISQLTWRRYTNTITGPLLDLSKLTQQVQKNQDFSLRADIKTNNEVGSLASNFNRMMEQLQHRDVRLKDELYQRRNAEERLNELAYFDNVTGLNNRHYFMEQLNNTIGYAEHSQQNCAVLFIDLDGFKKVNDTLGHASGDQLLRLVSHRLREGLRSNDIICRLGGDEFAVIVKAGITLQQVETLAQRLAQSIAPVYLLEGERVFVTASIGISLYPEQADNLEMLIRNADIAMYQAKEQGKNGYCIYHPSSSDHINTRFRLENDLHEALASNQFSLHYQPLFNADNLGLSGFEALLRWRHPDLGYISPGNFIPYMESTELIFTVGEWVLEKAIQQLVEWKRLKPDLYVSINLSGRQLKSKASIDRLMSIFKESPLNQGDIELELTESSLLETSETIRYRMQQLLEAGFLLALDDFGTGYSSLSYLHNFPFTRIKIDRAFANTISPNPDSHAMIRAIVAIGDALNLSITAEGIENKQQLKIFSELGIDNFQGFYLGKPMPENDALTVIEQHAKIRTSDERSVLKGG